ncbi:protein Shroom2 isoform X1 [Osmerus eperlanus]|uniref:protein Shroom2 isoform X1 n=1 Tax=Osmerus eperlanus TaxID=29151 RepID=UPI002E10FF8C
MDVVDYRTDLRLSAVKVKWFQDVGRQKTSGEDDNIYKLVDVHLTGGAPWGFTLRGGLEHREPLIITKVEEGSKAAAVSLQVGDEIVNVNTIPLSGSRQEAVCLVKSSYKSLALVVRRKNRFKGSDEPVSRPHSWHSAKLTEDQPEPSALSQPEPAPARQVKHEARPSSRSGDPTNLRQLSSQFSSVSSMERLERPFPQGRPSPPRLSSPTPGKRDSSFSCFSATSSPPDPPPPSANSSSTENIFYKGLQNEAARPGERPRFLQLPLGNGGWESPRAEDQPGARFSSSGRSNIGPVWHIPEGRKTSPSSSSSSSSPPPPPPLRSDSFAATKVFPYPEGPGVYAHSKLQGRSMDRLSDPHRVLPAPHQEEPSEARRSYNPPQKDFLHPSAAAEDHKHDHLNPNKLFSQSSVDVRQSPSPFAQPPHHQRQYSDETTFYLHTRVAPPAKPQSVGSYYRSLQDLLTNSPGQARTSTASLSTSTIDQYPDLGGHIRYYCITAKQPGHQEEAPVWQAKANGGGGGRGGGGGWRMNSESNQRLGHNDKSSSSTQIAGKIRYSPPQPPPPHADGREHNGQFRPANGHAISGLSSNGKASSEEKAGPRKGLGVETQGRKLSPSEAKVSPPRELLQDPWLVQEDRRFCPQKTPLLHSLVQEGRSLVERPPPPAGEAPAEPPTGKLARRTDRYATTLRNEIQLKRAQLQKSRSAATLSCSEQAEDKTSTSSSSEGSFSTSYKDHLKEAQARVLQATSFRRRDLEPPGADPPTGKQGSSSGHVTRIGGRKRFPLNKRMHSFSEPDQINKVGVEGGPRIQNPGSFVDRQRFFETTSAQPPFSRPAPKPGQQGSGSAGAVEPGEGRGRGRTLSGEALEGGRLGHVGEPSSGLHHQGPDPLSPRRRQALLEQQRLGTFAEYQATWGMQRKSSDTRTQGRYHSAENILDPEVEEKSVCVHERSRSSPSADFYGQNPPVPWREAADQPSLEHRRDQPCYPHREPSECGGRERLARSPQIPASSPPPDHALQLSHGDNAPTLPTLPPCPHNHIPSPASESPASQPPKSLPPPQRLHVGLETTASSLEFLPDAQAHPGLRSSHPDTQLDPAPARRSSLGSALALAPCPGRGSGLEAGRRPEAEEEEGQRGTTEPPPSSSSFAPLSSEPATHMLRAPSSDRARSPSPHAAPPPSEASPSGAPPRRADKASLSVQNEPQTRPASRIESVMESSGPGKKAPVKVVHADSSEEREGHRSLLQGHQGGPEGVGPLGITLGPLDLQNPLPQPSSHALVCAFTRPLSTPDTTPAKEALSWAPDQDQNLDQEPLPALPLCITVLGRRCEEDLKREELARDIMGRDRSLADILDQSRMKTTMDLMEGIFPQGQQLLQGTHQRRKVGPKQASPRTADNRDEEEGLGVSASVSLVPSSSYYSTSAPKAELLIKMKGMQEQLQEPDEEEEELEANLASKKQELIDSLSRKLRVLREARESVQEDVLDNNTLGREVEATVQQACRPNELDKFRMFVGDLDKVVSLLLSLSGRLARVENALNSLEEDAPTEEKCTLMEKRKLLIRQHEDAKELKENLDRREGVVYCIMAAHLSQESLDDYQHFVKMKSALIIEQRKLEDKIKLGEEQLKCLTDSLPLEQRMLF